MNVAEKLAAEISRVSALREQYRSLDGMPGVNVKPAVWMMDVALDKAKEAAGIDDAIIQMTALVELEGEPGWRVGSSGVTAIVAYDEYGEFAMLPWVAVYRGDEIIVRVPAQQVSVHYV